MCAKKTQTFYTCGHPRPQGAIRALIAHAKPIICPHSRPKARLQAQLPHDKSSLSPPSSSHAIIFNNPFNDLTALPPPYSSSEYSSSRNSLAKVSSSASSSSSISLEREITHEERVAAGMEYMHAFLASRSRSSSATSSHASSVAPAPREQMSRRAAVGAA